MSADIWTGHLAFEGNPILAAPAWPQERRGTSTGVGAFLSRDSQTILSSAYEMSFHWVFLPKLIAGMVRSGLGQS
jgi:hypothetical protein